MKPERRGKEALAVDVDLALKSVFDDPSWTSKIGIGGMLYAVALITAAGFFTLPIALIALALAQGYQLRVMRERLKKSSGPLPYWDDWSDLLWSGLTWLALEFGIWLSFVSIATAAGIVGYAAYSRTGAGSFPQLLCCLFVALLSFCTVHFTSSYLMLNFAQAEKLGAGLNVFAVLKKTRERRMDFLFFWLLSLAMQTVAVVLPSLLIVGVFLVPSALFFAQLVSASLLSQVWRLAEVEDEGGDQAKAKTKARR